MSCNFGYSTNLTKEKIEERLPQYKVVGYRSPYMPLDICLDDRDEKWGVGPYVIIGCNYSMLSKFQPRWILEMKRS